GRNAFHRRRASASASESNSSRDRVSASDAHRLYRTANSHVAKYRSSANSAMSTGSAGGDHAAGNASARIAGGIGGVVVAVGVDDDRRTVAIEQPAGAGERDPGEKQVEPQLSGGWHVNVGQITGVVSIRTLEAVVSFVG